ncbi:MAG: PP2C family protein-serine/threonine phosphatase [Chloroflexi bacterium]|nr:PP2C family protein-serine/threonine phosphatase [Chloroflexota bacterium]
MNGDLLEKLEFQAYIGNLLGDLEDIPATIKKIIHALISITAADQGYLLIRDGNGEFKTMFALMQDKEELKIPQSIQPEIVFELIQREHKSILSQNTQQDERFRTLLSVSAFHISSMLWVPISMLGELVGVIYLQNTSQKNHFTRDDLELTEFVAPGIGLLFDHARLQQVLLDKGRLEREMQMAREVQDSLIPKEIPSLKGWKADFCWQPALEVGGDFFDFIPIDEHHLGLVIADVSDKGMPAALFMALSRTILRAVIENHGSAMEMITRANHLIHQDAKEGMFVTLFFGILDTESGKLTYVNAGHNPPFLYNQKEQNLSKLMPTGMALGMESHFAYQEETVQIDKGDFLFLYTDGALDAMVRQKPFNEEELLGFIQRHRNGDPGQIVKLLQDFLCGDNSGSSSNDDLTIVVWKRNN